MTEKNKNHIRKQLKTQMNEATWEKNTGHPRQVWDYHP